LIDCHVHVTAVHHGVLRLSMQPPSLITAQAKDVLEGMLARGFTTVRDACGADFGLQEAVERRIFDGPRLFIAGRRGGSPAGGARAAAQRRQSHQGHGRRRRDEPDGSD
jgi:imidazolonepropionase-like amidohydrolase